MTAADRHRQFTELLGQHERQLSGYVLSLVPNWAEADEIVQQTRIRLWEQFDNYQSTGDFAAWARAIAFYQVRTYRKRAGRESQRLTTVAVDMLAEDLGSMSDHLKARHYALAECLERLAASKRELLARCYSGLESIKEIAASVGCTPGALRQKLFNLRKILHGCIDDKLRSENR
jgi:RNA polymerase sigma-70 factor (ECF subfamily)